MEGEGGGGGETFPFKRFTFTINAFYNVAFEHTLLKHAVRREIEGKVREGDKRETERDRDRETETERVHTGKCYVYRDDAKPMQTAKCDFFFCSIAATLRHQSAR